MTGLIIGMALLVGGGVMHDENFKPNDLRFFRMEPAKWSDHREGMGYLLGTAGGAVLAWNLHDRLPDSPWKRFLTQSLLHSLAGALAGGTLVGVGLIVHEDPARGDRDTRYEPYERQRTNDLREHFGYLLGPLGAAAVTLSIKGCQKKPTPGYRYSPTHLRVLRGDTGASFPSGGIPSALLASFGAATSAPPSLTCRELRRGPQGQGWKRADGDA